MRSSVVSFAAVGLAIAGIGAAQHVGVADSKDLMVRWEVPATVTETCTVTTTVESCTTSSASQALAHSGTPATYPVSPVAPAPPASSAHAAISNHETTTTITTTVPAPPAYSKPPTYNVPLPYAGPGPAISSMVASMAAQVSSYNGMVTSVVYGGIAASPTVSSAKSVVSAGAGYGYGAPKSSGAAVGRYNATTEAMAGSASSTRVSPSASASGPAPNSAGKIDAFYALIFACAAVPLFAVL